MELSSIIGKQILSPSGEMLGYVKGAYLSKDCSKLSCLICIDAEEEEFILPVRGILALNDAVIAGKMRLGAPTGIPSPVGSAVYSHRGELLGTVSDFLFGHSITPVFAVMKDGVRTTYSADCVSAEKTVIVYPDAVARKAAAPRKNSSPRKKNSSSASESASVSEQPKKSDPKGDGPAEEGFRLNLLGKQVKKSVFDGQGFPIVRAGERITPEVLLAARRNNRLLQLTVNTLTNIW